MNPEACKKCEHVSRSLHFCTLDPNNPEPLAEMTKPPEGCPNFFKHVVAMGMEDKGKYADNLLDVAISVKTHDGPVTLRKCFAGLLSKLWEEGENFDGKRPWGDSGWKYDIYAALIKAGVVPGELDEYGYVAKCDTEEVDRAILSAIKEGFYS